MARWESETRAWAFEAARSLVHDICTGRPLKASPYNLGVVLDVEEGPWIEIPARFANEAGWDHRHGVAPIRPWLITTERIVGRQGDDQLCEWRWRHISGLRIDLSPSSERVSLDMQFGGTVTWKGPGVAPLAVVAIYTLWGPKALIDVLGLEGVRLIHSASA